MKLIIHVIIFCLIFIDHKTTCCKAVVLHALSGIDTLDTWYLKYLQFVIKIFLAFLSSLVKQLLSLFFCDLFYLDFNMVSNISLKFMISFYISCNSLWKSVDEIMLAMLSNLLWASSLISWCFSCFALNILKEFYVIGIAWENEGYFHLMQYKETSQCHLQMQHWKSLQQFDDINTMLSWLWLLDFLPAFLDLEFHQVNMS